MFVNRFILIRIQNNVYTFWKGIYYNNTTLIIYTRVNYTHDNTRLSILYISNLTAGISEKYTQDNIDRIISIYM